MVKMGRITGRLSRHHKRWIRHYRRRHGVNRKAATRFLRRAHTFPGSLINAIVGRRGVQGVGYGGWKAKVGSRKRILRKHVRHGKHRFLHTWSHRSGHRIRRLGKKGWISKTLYSHLKRKSKARKRKVPRRAHI
jgi:hypothetical protein